MPTSPYFNKIIKTISDPTRRRIMSLVSEKPLNPVEIASIIGITRPAIEKHLKILLQYSLVRREMEQFPTPRYVYLGTEQGIELTENMSADIEGFVSSVRAEYERERERIEKGYLLGFLTNSDKKQRLIQLEKMIETFKIEEQPAE